MGPRGGAIVTWFGEGLAQTLELGNGPVVMARNSFPWLECERPFGTCLKSGWLGFQALSLIGKEQVDLNRKVAKIDLPSQGKVEPRMKAAARGSPLQHKTVARMETILGRQRGASEGRN
ncbi:hypothetical protein FNV43_RR11139 [Rhamnella rubrinervis]|uniref:Uncharacterized protein n=1 Tax=Rhamnella rubrinervis TaxID=2594499 RepID=A0A8K0H551_9ROSA|nr:hypothetical protein FNV43_RR11139 [Rhamnella rubrinervis]